MTADTNIPAFPTEPNTQPGFFQHHGMSLRDYFAGQAVSILPLRRWDDTAPPSKLFDTWATAAYALADAMLEARARKEAGKP